MEDPEANLPLSPPSPNPPSPGNNENNIEARRRSPLMNARSLSPSSSILSSLANNENKNKSVQIRFIRSVKSPSASSPNPSPQGNDENESEENPNSVQVGAKSEHQSEQSSPKNFMSPTISTASKCFPYKKKILSEWADTSPDTHLKNPSNLGPKSEMVTSSSTPTNSLSKIPFSGSPNSASKSDDVIVEDETFIPDPSTKPYDPLTNYLSPRPKFLLYNPNRRRKSILLTQSEQGCSPCPSVSHTSSAYSTAESSMRPDLGGNGQSEKQEEEVAKDQEEEEEEMMGVGLRKCGLKWGLFKSLIVLIVLVLSTMYISSMNNPEPASGMRGLKVEYQEFGNNTFRGVLLRSIEFGSWVLDMREESEIGMLKIDEIFVGGGGRSSVKTYEMDDNIEDQELQKVAEKTESLEDYSRNLTPFGTEDGTSPILENLEDGQPEIEVPVITQTPNQTIEGENLVFDANLIHGEVENKTETGASDDIEVTEEDILAGYESNSKDKQLTNEAEFVAESPHLEIKEENVADYKVEVVEFEPKSEEEQLEDKVDIVSEDVKRIKEENLPDCDELMAECERKSEDRSEIVIKNPIKEALEGNTFESRQKQFRLNPKNALWLVIPSGMTWVAALVVRFYLKCKKASSKTIPSNVKLSTQMKKNSSRLPPKAGGKTTQIQKTDPKLNPPSVLSRRQKLKASSRIIPRVEILGEFVIGGEFRRSKIQEIEESIHSYPEAPKVTYSSPAPTRSHLYTSEISEAESSPHGSFVSHDKTAHWQDGKEEVNKIIPTPLRRSSRLCNKAVTSP